MTEAPSSPPVRAPVFATRAPQPSRAALPPVQRRPELAAFKPASDPIDESQYPGTPDGDAAAELTQVQSGFRERMAAESKRRKSATDPSYYFVVAFESGEQAAAFLQGVGMSSSQTGQGELFIDGRAMADRLKIALPKAETSLNPSPRIDRDWSALVRKPGAK